MKLVLVSLFICVSLIGCEKDPPKAPLQTSDAKPPLSKKQSKPVDSTAKNSQRIAPEQKNAAKKFLKYAQSDPTTEASPVLNSDIKLPIRQVDEDHITVGQFLVNRKQGWIKIRSKVNQNEEILEYLSCGPRGKLHECVLLSFGLPMHLHVALILLGAEPGGRYGTELILDVEWQDPQTGEVKKHSAAKFLYDRLKLRAGQDVVWSFVGSRYMDGRYAANETQSLVAVINDSEAVIGIKNVVGNAHKGPQQGFEGNKQTTPPPGTPVDLYVRVSK